ncbi:hypothetical protein DTO027B9_2525 [Paecilomyces variotii]|nr:hypothetical protein DTO027B9_2525 [Paecilomyces variotii]
MATLMTQWQRALSYTPPRALAGLELDEQITPWVQNPFNGSSTVGQIIEAIGMNITVSGGTEENRPRTSDETRAVPLSGLLILETLRAVSYPINILRLEPLVRYR